MFLALAIQWWIKQICPCPPAVCLIPMVECCSETKDIRIVLTVNLSQTLVSRGCNIYKQEAFHMVDRMNGIGTMFSTNLDLWPGWVRRILFDKLRLDLPLGRGKDRAIMSSREGAVIDNKCSSEQVAKWKVVLNGLRILFWIVLWQKNITVFFFIFPDGETA